MNSATHLPPASEAPKNNPRLPAANADPRGPGHSVQKAPQRSQETGGLRRRKETFPRSARLRRREEFREVLRKGKRRNSGPFTVYILRRDSGTARLGLIVSRRVGKATRRNKVKRQLREIFRRHRSGLQFGVDLVVRAKPGITSLDCNDLEKRILEELDKLGVKL